MGRRSTWILLIIAAAFVGYFALVEQPRHRREQEKAELSKRLTDLTREEIQHVTIHRSGELLEFSRTDADWDMTSPIRDRGEEASINMLIASAVDAEIERELLIKDEDLPDFGLGDAPDALLILRAPAKDASLTIRIGSHNITKSHFYAQKDTAPSVLLLPAGLRRYALDELSKFRNKKVIEFASEAVKKIKIASPERILIWEKDARNQWLTAQRGDTIRGDGDEIGSILNRLSALRVKQFVSDDPREFGKYFPEKHKSITLWLGDEEIQKSLAFGEKKPDSCYAKLENRDRIVLTSDARILEVFDKNIDDLRDHHALRFDRIEVSMIKLATADTTAKLIKAGNNQWAFSNPALGSIEQRKMNTLFSRLESIEFGKITKERVEDPARYGFSEDYFKVTIYDWYEEVIDELTCGVEDEEGISRYASSHSMPVLASIKIAKLEELENAFHDVRKKE